MKIVNLDENVQTDLFGKYGLSNAVETLTWASPDSEDLYGAGFTNGNVQFWNPITRRLEHDCGNRGGKIKGLFTFENGTERMVATCTDNKFFEVCPVVLPEDYKHTQKKLRGNDDSAIWRMRPNPISHQHIMYMGYHVMPSLYDFEKDKTVWRGQFGSPKFYGLKQKQFFTDFQFMPESASVLITGSRYREFRIYDLREGNKPVMFYDVSKTSEWEFAMISLAVSEHTPTLVYATEATGKIASFDLRNGQLHKIYRDGMGTVKQLAFHPTERYMGAVSLDRYLRVYDIDKRLQRFNDKTSLEYKVRIEGTFGANMYNKIFLKQKLNSMLFFSEGRVKKILSDKAEERRERENRKEEEEDDEIMEDNGEDNNDDNEDDDDEVREIKTIKREKKKKTQDDDDVWGGLEQVGDVKDEPESDDEDEDDDIRPTKAKNGKTIVKDEDDDDDELLWNDDEEDDNEEEGDDSEEEDDIKLGEFNDDDEGETKEDEEDDSDDDDEEEGEGDAKSATKSKGPKGPKSTDNKRKRRVAQEKLEKQKKLKQKKSNIKQNKLMIKKRKLQK